MLMKLLYLSLIPVKNTAQLAVRIVLDAHHHVGLDAKRMVSH